jgi:hypothetical protein
MSEKKNKEGRHVGLDFYDLLIEALKALTPRSMSVIDSMTMSAPTPE